MATPTPTAATAAAAAAAAPAIARASVVVVGGGLAGLAAALAAAAAGAPRVVLLDKAGGVGGNSAKASSGVSAVAGGGGGAPDDAVHLFRDDLMASGRGRAAVHLADALAAQGGGAQGVDLSDVRQLGGHSRPRTHRPPQTGGKPAPVGWTIISALKRRVAAVAAIETVTSARVVQLLTRGEAAALGDTPAQGPPAWPPVGGGKGLDDIDDTPLPAAPSARPEVGGVVYVDTPAPGGGGGGGGGAPDGGAPAPARHAVLADAVVLATGGYCAPGNPVLAAHAAAAAAGLPSTNAALATGDGVRLGGRLGAGTVDLDAVQVHPTGFVPLGAAGGGAPPPVPPTVFLAPEALRGCGGVLVDAAGRRFVNELDARDAVTAAMRAAAAAAGGGDADAAAGGGRIYMLLSVEAVEAFGAATARFYAAKGLMAHVQPGGEDPVCPAPGSDAAAAAAGDTDVLAALERRVGLPAAAVGATLAAVAGSVDGEADAYGKRVFPAAASYAAERVQREGIWVAAVTPALHYSMGGLTFSGSAEVLTAGTGKPIRRLFAAGEVTGGLFGGNRLGGCSLLDCAVFGRIAGARAAAADGGSPPVLSPGVPVPLRLSERRFLTANGAAAGRSATAMLALRFDLPSPLATTGATVGQYVSAAVPLPDGSTTKRFYSPISRPDDEGALELLVKAPPPPGATAEGAAVHVGSASAALATLRPGDTMAFDGPHGGLPFSLRGPGHVTAVVGGTGVSVGVQLVRYVLHAAAAALDAGGAPAAGVPGMTLVWAVASPDQLVYRGRMEAQAASAAGRAAPLKLVWVVEAGAESMVAAAADGAAAAPAAAGPAAAGHVGLTAAGNPVYAGRVTPDLLAAELPTLPRPDGHPATAVLCGPPPMCRGVRAAMEGLGYAPGNVYSWV